MPISVTCTKCGKNLKVKDEYVGKRMKCPKCGTTFLAVAGAPGGGGAMGAPSIAKKPQVSGPSFHMSPGVIIFILAFVLIGGTIIFWNLGPGKARSDWAKQEPQAKQEVTDVIERGLQSSQADDEDLGGGISIAHNTPHVIEVTFPFTLSMMSIPDEMTFVGTTSKGTFRGKYNPKTGEIEADVDVNGATLSTGIVQRAGTKQVRMTGHSRNGKFEALVNGQPATVNFGDPTRHGI
jgi:hypothetical protein